jgi:hypothetical protein
MSANFQTTRTDNLLYQTLLCKGFCAYIPATINNYLINTFSGFTALLYATINHV